MINQPHSTKNLSVTCQYECKNYPHTFSHLPTPGLKYTGFVLET